MENHRARMLRNRNIRCRSTNSVCLFLTNRFRKSEIKAPPKQKKLGWGTRILELIANCQLLVAALLFLFDFFAALGLGGGNDFFLLQRRHDVVVVHLHGEAAAALCH